MPRAITSLTAMAAVIHNGMPVLCPSPCPGALDDGSVGDAWLCDA